VVAATGAVADSAGAEPMSPFGLAVSTPILPPAKDAVVSEVPGEPSAPRKRDKPPRPMDVYAGTDGDRRTR